jgi:hypothetical protein
VAYDPALTFLRGAGGSTLIVVGFEVTIDARQLSTSVFSIAWVAGNLDSRKLQPLRVVPGRYGFTATALAFTFIVTPTGKIDYDRGLTYLSGQGTTTLVVTQSGRGSAPLLGIGIVLVLLCPVAARRLVRRAAAPSMRPAGDDGRAALREGDDHPATRG